MAPNLRDGLFGWLLLGGLLTGFALAMAFLQGQAAIDRPVPDARGATFAFALAGTASLFAPAILVLTLQRHAGPAVVVGLALAIPGAALFIQAAELYASHAYNLPAALLLGGAVAVLAMAAAAGVGYAVGRVPGATIGTFGTLCGWYLSVGGAALYLLATLPARWRPRARRGPIRRPGTVS